MSVNTDLAAVAEEVVEGVIVGQVYSGFSSSDMSDVSAETRGKTGQRGLSSQNRSPTDDLPGGKSLEITLEIEHKDFTFTTNPGAFRRLLMNILSNALKYTAFGVIAVTLSQHEIETKEGTAQPLQPNATMVVLKVQDTGRGIADSYLQNRLFTGMC